MIDREIVGEFSYKPPKDREQEAEEKEDINIVGL